MHGMDEAREAERSLDRLLPRVAATFGTEPDWLAFRERLERYFADLFSPMVHLYGDRYDFFYHLESVLTMAARMWRERPADLKALDVEREREPTWFQSQSMVGGMCYVDLYCGTLARMREHIPYLQDLGLTYLHLMPLFATPQGNNDGGYAVSDYRMVNPALGTMADLTALTRELRRAGISPVLDFVFNHTADDHRWARAAAAGDERYQDFYFLFPDRTMPDLYATHLRDIFPEERPGSFTYRPDMGRWVWTTFYSFQWDLNYGNPEVFAAMAEEMLFLANQGAEILRLDALAFIWKQPGTACENLPGAHLLIQAFNAVARMAAPLLLFKSEAIVHPDEVTTYIGPNQCQLSYNPMLMALLWESLATRQVRLLTHALMRRRSLGPCCAWVNYVRSHDDIGWTFDDADAAALGINPYDHRRFLNDFYTGRFPGSFARGLPFQENPQTGDARVSGTTASLAGLERAVLAADDDEIELSLRRILLLHGIALAVGGIPLLYLGDENAMLNDYGYQHDERKAADSRWVHRMARQTSAEESSHARGLHRRLVHMVDVRKACAALAGTEISVVHTGNEHVFGFGRGHAGQRVLVLANFSERQQVVSGNLGRIYAGAHRLTDLLTGRGYVSEHDIVLEPYALIWLAPEV